MNKYLYSLFIALALITGLFLAPVATGNVLLVVALCCAVVFFVANHKRTLRRSSLTGAINIAEGTHMGKISKKADAAIATRYLLVKFGTDVDHVAVNGANDKPLGISTDESAAAEDLLTVAFLGAAGETRKCVVSEAIALTDELWTAAGGKVQNVTATAGTYYKVGRPLQVGAADGDVIEFEPCFPVAIVVT